MAFSRKHVRSVPVGFILDEKAIPSAGPNAARERTGSGMDTHGTDFVEDTLARFLLAARDLERLARFGLLPNADMAQKVCFTVMDYGSTIGYLEKRRVDVIKSHGLASAFNLPNAIEDLANAHATRRADALDAGDDEAAQFARHRGTTH